MDADYDPTVDRSFGLGVQRKKKKKSKFAQAVEKKKPVFDPSKLCTRCHYNPGVHSYFI